ncbi:MAG: hypothetical protein F4X19_05425, partial [Acidobacteria bacterium]|nr:hypothetical protein [Acidobacteriota bacterium]
CDTTMSNYLKLLMHAIFGAHNFRNEVSWSYRGREMHTTKKFNAKHDTVLFYAQSPAAYVRMKAVAIPYDRAERLKMLRRKIHVDDDGREWVWETRGQASGQQPYKRLVDDIVAQGRPLNDVWEDLQFLRGNHPERTGYPTQKPLKLLERIIKASSDEGDIVLDPFCGCATTCVSAEMLGRQWAGIDIELKARDLVLERLQRQADEALLAGGSFPEIHHLTRPPKRTDPDAPSRSRDIKQVLYRRQEGRCAGQCGADSQGRKLDLDLFEVDHIVPRSKGGADVDDNLQLLCPTCNRRKGSRTMAHLLSLTSE